MYSAGAGADQAPFPSDAIGRRLGAHPSRVRRLSHCPASRRPRTRRDRLRSRARAARQPPLRARPASRRPRSRRARRSITASPSAAATVGPASTPTASARPSTTATPDPTPATTPSGPRVATRVVIPALDIDLPVIRPPGDSTTYPLCNVAMYIQSLSQPGSRGRDVPVRPRARRHVPAAARRRAGSTTDGACSACSCRSTRATTGHFLYEISEVRRHQLTLDDAVAAKNQQLWLQTSEGPHGTPGKLQVVATPLSSGPADPQDAQPARRTRSSAAERSPAQIQPT